MKEKTQEKPKGDATANILFGKALISALEVTELPDLRSIVCEYFRQEGGTRAFVKKIRDAYRTSTPQSPLRGMILNMILKASAVLTEKEASKDLSLLSDEDIEKELHKALEGVRTEKEQAAEAIAKQAAEVESNGPGTSPTAKS